MSGVQAPAPPDGAARSGADAVSAAQPSRARRGLVRSLLVVLGALVLAGLLALVALVVLVRLLDRPPAVPSTFRVPATLPQGTPVPASHLAFDSDRTGTFELYLMDGTGGQVRALTNDAAFDSWWPRISPDRRTILFHRTPAGTHDRDYSQTSLWAVAADGGPPVELRPAGLDGWSQQGHAEWAPDGSGLVMFGGSRTNPQIYLTDRLGQSPRALTDRPGANLDPSFSTDGTHVYFVGCPQALCTGGSQEVYRVPVAGGEPVRLTDDDWRDQDPYLSPDGTQLAWLTQVEGGLVGVWDVRVGDAEGRDAQLLAGDKGITSRPQWSADGRTIYVHRMGPDDRTFAVYAYDRGSTTPRNLTAGQPGTNEYPGT